MNNYKFLFNGTQDITGDILQFNYSESLEDVASSFNFSSLVDFGLTTGDTLNNISLIDNTTNNLVYFGYVTDYEHTTDKNVYNYSGFDVGFYLNKNEVIKQFVNANIGDAIEALCTEYNISAGVKVSFNSTVSKIYKDVIFSDILKELLELEKTKGGNYDLYIDCKNGNLNIEKYQYEYDLSSVIANNVQIDSTKTANNANYKISIQDLKNRVIYSDNNEKSIIVVEQSKQDSINKYGLLTSVETVDTNKNNNLSLLAQNKLAELNKEKEEISFSMLGNYKMSKGKIITPKIDEYKLTDTYLINRVSHSIDECKEVVKMTVTKYER